MTTNVEIAASTARAANGVATENGYTRTEVGLLPKDWRVKPLGALVHIAHGFAFSGQHFANYGPYRLTTPGHFHEAGGFRDIGDKQKYYTGPVPTQYILQPQDLLVAMTEQATGLLGSAALIPNEFDYLHNQRLGRVAILPPETHKNFLYYVFNSRRFREKVSESAAGTKVRHTSPPKLCEILIPLPPTIAEQQAIAEALSDADALIEGLESLNAKKRAIKRGAMQELLTGKRRLPGFKGEWATNALGDIADTDPDALASSTPSEYHFKYISLENVDRGVLRGFAEVMFASAPSRARRKLQKHDVLVSTVRPNLQSHLLFTEDGADWICSTGFCVVRARKGQSNPDFIFANLFSDAVARQIDALLTGSNYPAINSRDVKALRIPCPSYEEQTAIADVLSDMDAELEALDGKLAKARAVKQGMMQELLTGRVRLI